MNISWVNFDQYSDIPNSNSQSSTGFNPKQRYLNIDGQYYSGIVIAGPTASGKSSYAMQLLDKISSISSINQQTSSANTTITTILNNHISQQPAFKPVIINADSIQVYNVLPRLSAQPTDLTDHYLYNFLDITQDYSSHQWLVDLRSLLADNPHFFPIIVGGTGFYINALLSGIHPLPPRSLTTPWDHLSVDECTILVQQIDPVAASQIKDHRRLIRFLDLYHNHELHQFKLPPPIKLINRNFYTIYVTSDNLRTRIRTRLISDFPSLIEEVQQLQLQSQYNTSNTYNSLTDTISDFTSTLPTSNTQSVSNTPKQVFSMPLHTYSNQNTNITTSAPAMSSNLDKIIGYTEINSYLSGDLIRAQAIEQIYTRTCQYSRRQSTWFKKYYKPNLTVSNN